MTVGGGQFDKLSNLTRELQSIELEHANSGGTTLAQARSAVVNRLSGYRNSRFQLGRVLRDYKIYFKAEHGWVVAAQAIAEAINRDPRTVFRIVEDFERASKLPPIVLAAMEAQKIDPAAPKNAEMVEKLAQMPQPVTHKKAELVVARVRAEHSIRKKAIRAANKPKKERLEHFAERVLRHFEERFGRDAELRFVLELIVNTLRVDIRELRQYGRPTLMPRPKREIA